MILKYDIYKNSDFILVFLGFIDATGSKKELEIDDGYSILLEDGSEKL